jgi:hypothetical protein
MRKRLFCICCLLAVASWSCDSGDHTENQGVDPRHQGESSNGNGSSSADVAAKKEISLKDQTLLTKSQPFKDRIMSHEFSGRFTFKDIDGTLQSESFTARSKVVICNEDEEKAEMLIGKENGYQFDSRLDLVKSGNKAILEALVGDCVQKSYEALKAQLEKDHQEFSANVVWDHVKDEYCPKYHAALVETVASVIE